MSVDSDKLGVMVAGYNTLVPALSASWDSITAEITDLYEQWSALAFAQDGIESDLETYVEANKADYFYSYGSFGVSGTGVLNEWMGFDEETGLSGWTYDSPKQFRVFDDHTSTFTVGTSGVCVASSTFSESSTISASWYSSPFTYVNWVDSIVPPLIDGVYLESYANWGPLWDSDTTVQGYMDDWVFVDDLITKTLSSTGTYGIQDTIAKLAVAKALVLINMNKYNGTIPIITTYAT
jgi:hypothetical protein